MRRYNENWLLEKFQFVCMFIEARYTPLLNTDYGPRKTLMQKQYLLTIRNAFTWETVNKHN